MLSHGRVIAVVAAALAFAGCGGHRSGKVGETFSVHGARVAVVRVNPNATPRHDVTGFGAPLPGNHLIGVKVLVCNPGGYAIGQYDFKLDLDDGSHATQKFPQQVYENGFETARSGCDDGWVVFEAPRGRSPKTVKFDYDNSGSGSYNASYQRPVHAHFRWAVGG